MVKCSHYRLLTQHLISKRRITKGCTRSTHSGGCEVDRLLFVPGEPRRYPTRINCLANPIMTAPQAELALDAIRDADITALSKLPRKKIMFEGTTPSGLSILVVTPSSKRYPRGNGWVDFTDIQIEMCNHYDNAIAAFCIADGDTHFVDMAHLLPSLTDACQMENDREGIHWKLDIWDDRISIRNGGESIPTQKNSIAEIQHALK